MVIQTEGGRQNQGGQDDRSLVSSSNKSRDRVCQQGDQDQKPGQHTAEIIDPRQMESRGSLRVCGSFY